MPSPPTQSDPSARLDAITTLVLAVAAAMWFSWAASDPDVATSPPLLDIGAWVAVAIGIAAAVQAWRCRPDTRGPRNTDRDRRYLRIVATEVAAIAVGWVVLAMTGQTSFLSAWILLVVGVHFVPLGDLFAVQTLKVAGAGLAVVAAVAGVVGIATTVDPTTVSGAGGGTVLLISAAWTLQASMSH